MKPVLLIWDIDGTLMNSMGIGRRAMNNTFKTLYNIDNGFDQVSMAGRLDYQIVKNAHKYHKINEYDVDNFYKTYESELRKELSCDYSAVVLPGVKKILDTKVDNLYHILGTGNCQIGAKLKLSHVGIGHYFDIGGYGDEDVDRWQIIEKAYREAEDFYHINFDKNNIYVIGDTPHDIECAKKLGFKSIGVSTGFHSMERLKECKADYVLEELDIDKLENIIQA